MSLKSIIIDDNFEDGQRLSSLIYVISKKIQVIAVERNIENLLKDILYYNPEIIFVEAEVGGQSGFTIIKEIKEVLSNPIFIMVSKYRHYAIRALKFNCFDYLIKPIDIDDLKSTIDRLVNPKEDSKKETKISKTLLNKLSGREQQVMACLFEGKSSKEIGQELKISKSTVDTHRRNILKKTGYKNTAEMICNH
jgi:two-component system LytT family response regulator